jgi:transcription elongation factor Elf1
MSSIRTFFRHCPACGRRFEIRLVGRKEVDSASLLEEEKRPLSPASPLMAGSYAAAPVVVQDEVPVMVDVDEFQYTYKCKHCGHQWSEVREVDKTFDLPQGYTGD